jgi:hypothetical protein
MNIEEVCNFNVYYSILSIRRRFIRHCEPNLRLYHLNKKLDQRMPVEAFFSIVVPLHFFSGRQISPFTVHVLFTRLFHVNFRRSMTSTHCTCDKRYKAAIALNNAAVSLLSRQRYKVAMDMLRISMNLIQLSCCLLGDIDQRSLPEPIIVPEDLIIHHLEIALHYRAEQSASSEPPIQTVATIRFSSQQDVWQVKDVLLAASANNAKNVFGYINIDPIDYECINLDTAYHNSIVILYNYGVAHCSLAQQMESNELQYPFARAIRKVSFQIFYNIDVYVRRTLANPNVSNDNSVLLLSALFTQTMSRLADNFCCTTISYYYSAAFEAIISWIDEQHKLFPSHDNQAAAA